MNVKVDDCAAPDLWSVESAFSAIVTGEAVAGSETLPISLALGRVTAGAIASRISLPRFDQSAMDGYGIHLDDMVSGRATPLQVLGLVRAGGLAVSGIGKGETVRLMTGAPLPAGVAAVVMEERVDRTAEIVHLRAMPDVGQNIRRRGEDVAEGAILVRHGQQIDARHIALLAAAGVSTVDVVRPVRIAVVSTGDELVDPGEAPWPTQVFDCNRPMLTALMTTPSTVVSELGRVPDEPTAYAAFLSAVHRDYDLIVTSGGVSGSDADHSVRAVEMAGGTSTRISLAMKPGKPIAHGVLGACRVIALPGNPVAAMVGALLFARPLVARLSGREVRLPEGLHARTASTFYHRAGRTEFVPAATTGRASDGHLLVEKLGKGGSARLAPLVAADGLALIPAAVADVGAEEIVKFYPFKAELGL